MEDKHGIDLIAAEILKEAEQSRALQAKVAQEQLDKELAQQAQQAEISNLCKQFALWAVRNDVRSTNGLKAKDLKPRPLSRREKFCKISPSIPRRRWLLAYKDRVYPAIDVFDGSVVREAELWADENGALQYVGDGSLIDIQRVKKGIAEFVATTGIPWQ